MPSCRRHRIHASGFLRIAALAAALIPIAACAVDRPQVVVVTDGGAGSADLRHEALLAEADAADRHSGWLSMRLISMNSQGLRQLVRSNAHTAVTAIVVLESSPDAAAAIRAAADDNVPVLSLERTAPSSLIFCVCAGPLRAGPRARAYAAVTVVDSASRFVNAHGAPDRGTFVRALRRRHDTPAGTVAFDSANVLRLLAAPATRPLSGTAGARR